MSENNPIPNLDASMSNVFVDLENEVNKRAAEDFHLVIARMLDLYEERLKRIIAMNNGNNGELEALRRLYVSIKLQLRRMNYRDRRWSNVANNDVINNNISYLEMQTKNARRKFYEFKRSIEPHTSDCECRGCKFLRKF